MSFSLRPLTLMIMAISIWSCLQEGDDEAYLSRPVEALSVGAYYSMSFGDACGGGGGKLPSFCSLEEVVSLDSLISQNPSIIRIIPSSQMPLKYSNADYFLFGVSPGKTTIKASGTFDDGSRRSDSFDVEVKPITSLQMLQHCKNDSSGTLRALPGEQVMVSIKLLNGKDPLTGCIPSLLDSLPGMTQTCSDYRMYATITTPQSFAKVEIKSRMLSKPSGSIQSVQPSEITSITLDEVNSPPITLSKPDSFAWYIHMSVGNTALCKTPPASLQTLTPNVCSGPKGQESWVTPTTGYVFIRGLKEGVCTMKINVHEGKASGLKSFKQFFPSYPDTALSLAGFGNPCNTEGATTCSVGMGRVAICKSKRWSEHQDCSKNEVCDFRSNTEKGCVAGSTCASCRGLK